MKMSESISVSSIIDKLPPQWKDFKHTLKHTKEDMSLVDLGKSLRIEESLRAQESEKTKDTGKTMAINMMEFGESSNSAYFMQDDYIAWWIDSVATRHVCKDRGWFTKYVPAQDGAIIYMENESTAPVLGNGKVILKFSSGKYVCLKDI
ncbi:hypothetical protein RND81_10G136900 [Saponaria officinalis]|uniref:Retrovirus-related Pol polyprotein from transposon TNT 1-94-like beta-barrel domain-containing protein n=1 Tax=Saponaria officinalis TaxID=3572 RepID=A0AAW1I1Z3_SAPOF